MPGIAKRKISTGPDLQPIFENEDVVQRFEYNVIIEPFPIFKQVSSKATTGCNRPPQPHAPAKQMAAKEQINFVSDTFAWLQKELEVLKQQEKKDDAGGKDIMHFYKNLMTTVSNLKRVTTTFQEQADQNTSTSNDEISSSYSVKPFSADLNTQKKTLLSQHVSEKGLCEYKEKQLPCT